MIFDVEGTDSVGKTTLVQSLISNYPDEFYTIPDHAIDSHPEMIRSEYVDVTKDDVKFFLYLAEGVDLSRAYKAALNSYPSRHLILDRGVFSMLAYFEVLCLDRKARYREILREYLHLIKMPDVVIYIKAPADVVESRLIKKGHRDGVYEQQAAQRVGFWNQLMSYYETWFRGTMQRVITIDGTKSIEEVREIALKEMRELYE